MRDESDKLRKINNKNQITLTKEAMDTMGTSPGDYVKVYVSDGHVMIIPQQVKEKKS